MYYFTADQHFGHKNIIKYCNRPYKTVQEMDDDLIGRHNSIVKKTDVVIHAGDFTLANKKIAPRYIKQLNGIHVFLNGSHDRWMKNKDKFIWEKKIEDKYVVVCHYAMLTWPRSHYGSWQLFGHSHGELTIHSSKLQYDIGVDNNNYYPVSFKTIREILG